MYIVKNGIKTQIFYDSLTLLSEKGSEFTVYYNDDKVYKIFKENYQLTHKTIEEFTYLSSIKTSRILMPESLIIENESLIGYSMQYIKNSRDLCDEVMGYFITELEAIILDIELLSKYNVRMIDINKGNTIYNGSLYLIDPGNYYINDIRDLLPYIDYKEPSELEKQHIIQYWNYDKLNKLIIELLFMKNPDVDFYILRKIIEFFDIKKIQYSIISDIPIYKEYFDLNLKISDSIKKFVKECIKVDESEKRLINQLIK